jgi:hypothetical protein
MSIFDWIMLAISVGLMIYGGWKFFPRSLYIFRLGPHTYFDKNVDTPVTKMHQETVQHLSEQLEALGFLKLGIKIEKPPLWEKAGRELAFASIKARAFASIFVIKNKTTCYFYTPFSEGQVVLTANDGFTGVATGNFMQSVVASADLEELLGIHQKRVEAFCTKGFTTFQEYTRETRIIATSQYYNSHQVRRLMRTSGAMYLMLFLIFCLPFFTVLPNILG